MSKYAIQRIDLRSALKFGVLIGPIVMFLPGLLLALLARWSITTLRGWLAGWNSLDLGLVNVNVLELVNLNDFLQTIQSLDEQGVLLLLMITVGSMILGMIQGGLLATLGAIAYNILARFGSGLVVSGELLHEPVQVMAGQDGQESGKQASRNSDSGDRYKTSPIPAYKPPPIEPQAHKNDLLMTKYSPDRPSGAPLTQVAPFAQDRPGAWLILRQNPQKRLPLKMGRTTIGRALDNDIPFKGLALHHVEVHFQDNHYMLKDRSNGKTWINRRTLIGPNLLKDGFVVRLGNYEFIFKLN